jgi:3-oxoacyl-[acyl-carrier protein] reductase
MGGGGPLLVVSGGAGVLATAIAERFAQDGWEVLRPGRTELDVSDAAAVAQWFRARPAPDLLVCAAGLTGDRLLARMSCDDWDRVLEVNLHGAARCARAVARGMVRRRGGHIVLVSSHSAWHPPVGQAAYAAAKAGLLGLARSLARELGPAGVRVNLLVPGFLDTPMTRRLAEERVAEARAAHLLGRFNGTAEVADFLHFLHHRLPHTSGQTFHLDSRIV